MFMLIVSQEILAQQLPNFVIILTDDQGWNALSTPMDPDIPGSGSAYYQTPNLDNLAKEGTRFPNAYSSAPTCAPSRHSLQFGRTPANLQIWKGDGIKTYDARDEDALANVLKECYPQYNTAHFGKWHIAHSPSQLGFEINDGANPNLKKSTNPDTDPKYTFSLTHKAIDFIETQNNAKHPFLLQVSYYANHLYFEAKPETIKKYTYDRADNKTAYQNNPVFAAMNEDLDTGIGMLIHKLKQLGIYDNTYIIFTSDNGYEAKLDFDKPYEERGYYKAHPLKSHKYLINEGGLRVPFIIKGPDVPQNTISRTPVSTIDIYPTILGILNLSKKIPTAVEGGNMMPNVLSAGKAPIERKNSFMIFRYSKPQLSKDIAIIEGDYKLIKTETSRLFLYNLKEDYGERHNLIDKYPELAAKLNSKMVNYFEGLKGKIKN